METKFGSLTPCTNNQQMNCAKLVYNRVFEKIEDACVASCPIECESVTFQVTTSSSEFPSNNYANEILTNSFVKTKYPGLNISGLKSNMLSLSLYYDELKYTEIVELPLFDWCALISSIGGFLGKHKTMFQIPHMFIRNNIFMNKCF